MIISIYTSIVSKFLFPLHEKLKGHETVQMRKQLEASQWWSRDRLEQHQLSRLRGLLSHAKRYVPYYQNEFQRIGFEPSKVRSLNELEILPFLTKPIIRENSTLLKSENVSGLSKVRTSGSTGEPLVFYVSKERVSQDIASKWRATRWWDVDIGDKEVVVWGSPIELNSQDKLRHVRDWIIRSTLMPSNALTKSRLDRFIREIIRIRPKMIFGYPSSINFIAQHAEGHAEKLDNLDIKIVFATGERLYDIQRQTIERVFGCPVADGYGGRDAGVVANQCVKGGMHISAEDLMVEIVDEHGDVLPVGQSGEVVITNFGTKDFPFIRYRTGDVAALSDKTCSCGRKLPLLMEIKGRTNDFIVSAEGVIIHDAIFGNFMREVRSVRAFRIVQESLELTHVMVESEIRLSDTEIRDIKEFCVARLGENVRVVVDQVENIPSEKSGKFRYVTSKVKLSQFV